MLMGQHDLEPQTHNGEMKANNEEGVECSTEETIISMHATSNNPTHNTMRFKGIIRNQPVFALIDSDNTHSFINPGVLQPSSHHVVATNPTMVRVANGERMVTDSKCEALQFSIQGHDFQHDLRILPV
jgi:Retroviral aspartyl protease